MAILWWRIVAMIIIVFLNFNFNYFIKKCI